MKQRKDGRWCKKITLPDGTKKYFYSNATSEKLAIADFNRQLLELKKDDTKKNSFSHVAESWSLETFSRVENNTLKQYRPGLKDCKNYFAGKNIQDITAIDVKNYVSMLEKNGLAKKTIKNRLSVLNLIMTYALIEQKITSNPCQFITIKMPNTREKRQAITKKEIKIVRNSSDCTFGFFALFLLYTGLRRGEAFALTPNDINYKEQTLQINKTVEWIGNIPQIKNHPKTVAGNRIIPLPDLLMDELKKRQKNNYIFENNQNSIMTNSQVTRAWDKYVKETGINATPHMLRHTYATMLFDADIDVKTAQTWLGHTDIKTTLDIYTHLSEQRRNKSTTKWKKYTKKSI